MKYRRFGKTELQMPVFSCGGMRYQHKWQDVPPGEVPKDGQANLEATIHRALELGINHIETARFCGLNPNSEMELPKEANAAETNRDGNREGAIEVVPSRVCPMLFFLSLSFIPGGQLRNPG